MTNYSIVIRQDISFHEFNATASIECIHDVRVSVSDTTPWWESPETNSILYTTYWQLNFEKLSLTVKFDK